MKPHRFAAAALAALILAGCLGGGGGGPSPVVPSEPEPADAPGVLSFNQSVPAEDGGTSPFPGQGNAWDIDGDFSLADGYDDQFDKALRLAVTVGETTEYFPSDQIYGELTFLTPVFGPADGLSTAAVSDNTVAFGYLWGVGPIEGGFSAYLRGTTDSSLGQALDLTRAVPPVTLAWSHESYLNNGSIDGGGIPMDPFYFRVMVRTPDGRSLGCVYSVDYPEGPGSFSADLSAFAGQAVVLSFEMAAPGHNVVEIDAVSATDSEGTEFVENGDFETGGLAPWSERPAAEPQNVASGSRYVAGLSVTRSFYTAPRSLWGRWTDVFRNVTASPVTATIAYSTNLGSDGMGIIYLTPGTDGKALSSWDGTGGEYADRDIGLVFGAADSVVFASDDGIGNGMGSDAIEISYVVAIPPGESRAIVNFVIMTGKDTGQTAASVDDRAVEVDAEGVSIVSGFRSDARYTRGMTAEQKAGVVNFPP